MADIPDSIRALAERTPAEDFVLDLFRAEMPEIQSGTLLATDQAFPFLLIRRIPGSWGSEDPRFLDTATMSIQAFVSDPNGDEDAGILSEAARVVLRDAWLRQTVIPGRGHLAAWEMAQAGRRASDWATATGPVQYADLPSGVVRYEARYYLTLRIRGA